MGISALLSLLVTWLQEAAWEAVASVTAPKAKVRFSLAGDRIPGDRIGRDDDIAEGPGGDRLARRVVLRQHRRRVVGAADQAPEQQRGIGGERRTDDQLVEAGLAGPRRPAGEKAQGIGFWKPNW